MKPIEKLKKAINEFESETGTIILNINVNRTDMGYALIEMKIQEPEY